MTPRATRILRGAQDGARWELAIREPCPALRPFVLRLHGYEQWLPRPERRRRFPQPFVVAILEFGPPLRVSLGADERSAARHHGGFLAGLGDAFAVTEQAGWQRGVQIDLSPTGARRLLGLPLSELAGAIVSLRDLLPEKTRVLIERLAAASDWSARLDLVEGLLLRRIPGARLDTRRVDWAIERIAAAGGALRIGPLASELGHSHRHLIALFRDQVGITPKLFARLVRFDAVLRSARATSAASWAELALGHGYSDQAHLVREVRRFTGLTPTRALAVEPDLGDRPG